MLDGFRIRVPMVDVNSIGAGGGSIAWIDAGGGLRVGPHSAGSQPGPACYGRGGTEATVTDASVVLGLVDPEYFAGGTLKLQRELALRAVEEKVARPLGMSVPEAALGSLTLAAWWASGWPRVRLRGQGTVAWALFAAVALTLMVAVTGAITALGDTLYPKSAVGLGEAAAATFLERLRIVHPAVAIATALYVVLAGMYVRRHRPGPMTARLSRRLVALFATQVMVGAFNVALLAPVWMQLVHLLVADVVWITLVCTTAAALAEPAPWEPEEVPPARAPAGVAGG
jgi:hypothetical protein